MALHLDMDTFATSSTVDDIKALLEANPAVVSGVKTLVEYVVRNPSHVGRIVSWCQSGLLSASSGEAGQKFGRDVNKIRDLAKHQLVASMQSMDPQIGKDLKFRDFCKGLTKGDVVKLFCLVVNCSPGCSVFSRHPAEHEMYCEARYDVCGKRLAKVFACLLYTSPSPRD
eukprot:10343259-Alexandrium_andersonii.AAC.1